MVFLNTSFMEDIKNTIKEIKRLKSTNSNQYINYSQYVAESLDKTIVYSEYIAENINNFTPYSDYIAEEIKKMIK
jgi:hypothetical protein